ncbi:MAG: SpoIIE family protein phosphatase [Leptospirales bacterium]|nr:SpoIIE family protein phosphatase [Leptospirales bacterium]
MELPGVDQLWQLSPAAQLIIDREFVREANAAALTMLGMRREDLIDASDWSERLFGDLEQSYRFSRFLYGDRRQKHLDLHLRRGALRHVRVFCTTLEEGELFHLALQDITDLLEDAQVYQAGYDEFLKVTTELEKALKVIERQNELLERQKHTLESELSIAHNVQVQLVAEEFSRFTTVRIAGHYATMADLGGDTWEFYEEDGEFYGVIGDVMGHGVAASLIGIAAKTLFKQGFAETARNKTDLARLTGSLNKELNEITRGNYYVTACMLHISPNGRMEYLTCGHPPFFIVRRKAGLGEQVFTSQPMLGIFHPVEFVSEVVQLHPGDRVLMYTDCLLESMDPSGNPLKLEEVTDMIRYAPNVNVEEALQRVLEFRRAHAQTAELPDDLALALLELPPGGG